MPIRFLHNLHADLTAITCSEWQIVRQRVGRRLQAWPGPTASDHRPTHLKVRYCDIVYTVLVPYVRDGSFHNDFIFQHDNAPRHMARVVKNHLEQRGVRVLPWCAKGADLNRIEYVWGRLKTSMVRQPLYSDTRYELWTTVSHE
ncbi:hypothetical protein HPB48_017554 [Haemaphysalis longicornis]|uniref:Tc1-like transposase DDE domain-containing protein n=1 Tax=Haemaphysalis longicornis TaxID=44386 RepID=A0A9J6FLA3_HAELO|nr:hypothetical protein HPB48_017554 [Haemaphysalis longicornis]